MKIKINDKIFWINKCKDAVANIKQTRMDKQIEYENKSWWYRLTNTQPIANREDLTTHSWNLFAQHDIEHFLQQLELPHCDYIIVNTNDIDLQYILDWAE